MDMRCSLLAYLIVKTLLLQSLQGLFTISSIHDKTISIHTIFSSLPHKFRNNNATRLFLGQYNKVTHTHDTTFFQPHMPGNIITLQHIVEGNRIQNRFCNILRAIISVRRHVSSTALHLPSNLYSPLHGKFLND